MKEKILQSLETSPKTKGELASNLGIVPGSDEYHVLSDALGQLEDLRPVNVSRTETKMLPHGKVDIARDKRNGKTNGYVYFCLNQEDLLVQNGKLSKETTVKTGFGEWEKHR